MEEQTQLLEMLSLGSPPQSCILNKSDEYDTDLEPDLEESDNVPSGVSWQELYVQACQQVHTVPVSYFIRHINEAHMDLSHHGLGPQGSCAIAVALVSRMEEQTQLLEMLSLGSPPQSCILNKSDEYDTDLEPDLEESDNVPSGVSWQELYVQACQQVHTVPVSYFIRHINEAHMDLSHHGLGPQGSCAIAVALVSNTSITHLHLEDNWIQPEGIGGLMEMLRENCCIQSLNLSNNRLGVQGSEVISRMLLHNISLKCIKLAKNQFSDESAKHFAESLSTNFHVTELDLSHNEFCESGGEYLGQLLAANEGLRVLDLSWNHIRLKGAIALSAGLRVNGMLRVLNLSHNGFSNEGALALGEALRANSSLQHLDISCNRISNEGVRLLCKGLESNETLQVLKLSMNPLTVEGAIMLITTISRRRESKVQELDISNVLVNERFLHLLEAATTSHPALQVLYAGERGFISRKPAGRPDPMKVIQDYLDEHKLRLLDFFRNMDKEGNMRIPVSEFRRYISLVGLPLNVAQVDALVQRLDKDQTGTVDYRDLVDSRKKMVKNQRIQQRKKEIRERQERQKSERALRSFHTAVRALTPPPASRGALGRISIPITPPTASLSQSPSPSLPSTELRRPLSRSSSNAESTSKKILSCSFSPQTPPTTPMRELTHSTSTAPLTVTPLSSWYQKKGSASKPGSPYSWNGYMEEGTDPQPDLYYSSRGSLRSECLSESLTPIDGNAPSSSSN